jgi:hypothetical protein
LALLRLIFCRVRQGPLGLEDLCEVATVDLASAGRTANEILGLVLRRITHPPAYVCAAWEADHIGPELLRQLNERDRQVLGRMPRPTAADGLQALGYIAVYSPNSQDLLFTITPAGRAALATIDAGT